MKQHKLEIVKRRWSDIFWNNVVYNYFVKIDNKEIYDTPTREELSYSELLAVWNFAVKNKNKLERAYLEKLYELLLFKKAFEKALRESKSNKGEIYERNKLGKSSGAVS